MAILFRKLAFLQTFWLFFIDSFWLLWSVWPEVDIASHIIQEMCIFWDFHLVTLLIFNINLPPWASLGWETPQKWMEWHDRPWKVSLETLNSESMYVILKRHQTFLQPFSWSIHDYSWCVVRPLDVSCQWRLYHLRRVWHRWLAIVLVQPDYRRRGP